jgi:Leucine-rich repeat (LRR) protein
MRITREFLKHYTLNFDLECVFELDLSKKSKEMKILLILILDLSDFVFFFKDISELDSCLTECINLEKLDLSFNEISNIYCLGDLTKLQFLNLSCNRISNIGIK